MTTQISASMVKDLREKTGAGMMDAKNALVEANGDMDKAAEILRQKGIATADKKSGRAAAEGLVEARISPDGKTGILVEVNCETDFVARGDAFKTMADTIANTALASKATTLDAFLQEKIGGQTVDEFVKENIGVIKENLTVRRFVRYQVAGAGGVYSYIHTGGKIGVLLELTADSDATVQKDAVKQLAKDLSMHIASSAPEYVNRGQIPADVVEEEKRIEMGKEDLQNKPVEIREKIVMGRIDKLLAQRVLLEQPFVKDPGKTVQELLNEVAGAAGGKLEVKQFVRFLLGEGVEKRQENFADEVMAQMKQ